MFAESLNKFLLIPQNLFPHWSRKVNKFSQNGSLGNVCPICAERILVYVKGEYVLTERVGG